METVSGLIEGPAPPRDAVGGGRKVPGTIFWGMITALEEIVDLVVRSKGCFCGSCIEAGLEVADLV